MALHTERSFSHDHEFVHMSMAMPASTTSLQKATNIMFNQEWLQPNFSSEIVELQKRHHIAEIHALKKDQGFQTKSHFIQALFERTKYHIPLDVRADAISKLSVDDVSEFHAKWIQSSADTYVTMVTPTAKVAKMLGNIFPDHDKSPSTTLEWTAKPRVKSEKHIQLAGFGSFQIMLGQTVSVLPFTKESIALECAATILGGGMTARLMHTVRELRGLGTYGLYAGIQHVSPKSPTIFCVQGTFSPTSLQDGLECTRKIVGEWARDGVTPVELATAKTHILGSKIIAVDTVDNLHSMVLHHILNQRPAESSFKQYKDILKSLTLEDVNGALRRHIDPTAFTSVVVGPPQDK